MSILVVCSPQMGLHKHSGCSAQSAPSASSCASVRCRPKSAGDHIAHVSHARAISPTMPCCINSLDCPVSRRFVGAIAVHASAVSARSLGLASLKNASTLAGLDVAVTAHRCRAVGQADRNRAPAGFGAIGRIG